MGRDSGLEAGGRSPGGGGQWQAELLREIKLLLAGRLCSPARQRRCQAEDQEFAGWACQNCAEYVRPEQVSPWSRHLLFLHRLQAAGYPFRRNDLSLETWMMLGIINRLARTPAEKSAYAIPEDPD